MKGWEAFLKIVEISAITCLCFVKKWGKVIAYKLYVVTEIINSRSIPMLVCTLYIEYRDFTILWFQLLPSFHVSSTCVRYFSTLSANWKRSTPGRMSGGSHIIHPNHSLHIYASNMLMGCIEQKSTHTFCPTVFLFPSRTSLLCKLMGRIVWTYGYIKCTVFTIVCLYCFVDLGVNPISTYICKTLIVDGPAHTKYDVSSLDPATQSNGTSVTNNQYEEEIGEHGISSSNVQPSDSSSQEGKTSCDTSLLKKSNMQKSSSKMRMIWNLQFSLLTLFGCRC